MCYDDWVKSAMEDNALVGEVLVKLRQSFPPPPPPPLQQHKRQTPAPPLAWTVRQRRSKPQMIFPLPASAKKSASTRASPTTPLSWSATSISGGAAVGTVDGVEESSRPTPNISRSKGKSPSETTPTKRPKKKKTLADLKEEEVELLKEQKQLKRQLATLQASCEKQGEENQRLKKMKADVQSQAEGERPEAVVITSGETQKPRNESEVVPLTKDSFEAKKDKFTLPDLNIPAAEDINF